jgi:transcriptional regulator with XRE-family HTH domain
MNKTEKRALGDFMKNQRKQLSLRQSDLASVFCISQSELSCIENGKSDLDIRVYLDYIKLIIDYIKKKR